MCGAGGSDCSSSSVEYSKLSTSGNQTVFMMHFLVAGERDNWMEGRNRTCKGEHPNPFQVPAILLHVKCRWMHGLGVRVWQCGPVSKAVHVVSPGMRMLRQDLTQNALSPSD